MRKVLVVDDSISVRKVLERALTALGPERIQVVSATCVGEALERIEREEPDLVLSDVILPDREGYEVCEFVKTHPRLGRTPVLLMSGIVNETVLERAARVRSLDVVKKPFAAAELASRIEGLLQSEAEPGRTTAPPEAPEVFVEVTDLPALPPPVPAEPRAAVASGGAPEAAAPDSPESAPRSEPPPGGRGEVPIEPVHPARDLRSVLEQLERVGGVRLAVLADRDGLLIESVGDDGIDPAVAGALAACLAESSEGLGHELGRGALQGMILEYDRGILLVHQVGPTAMLAIVLTEVAALGKLRYYVRRALPDLTRAL